MRACSVWSTLAFIALGVAVGCGGETDGEAGSHGGAGPTGGTAGSATGGVAGAAGTTTGGVPATGGSGVGAAAGAGATGGGLTCNDDADCPGGGYCAQSQGECLGEGSCFTHLDCDQPGNAFPRPRCIGYGVCEDGLCGWNCGDAMCRDLAGIDFGPCRMMLGYGVVDGECASIGGCGDLGHPFFATLAECESACTR
jgi:hypothetical protein